MFAFRFPWTLHHVWNLHPKVTYHPKKITEDKKKVPETMWGYQKLPRKVSARVAEGFRISEVIKLPQFFLKAIKLASNKSSFSEPTRKDDLLHERWKQNYSLIKQRRVHENFCNLNKKMVVESFYLTILRNKKRKGK